IWQKIKKIPAHNWSLLTAETAPPNGENFIDVQSRVSGFIKQNSLENIDRPRIMVTHAGVIRSFIGLALELDSNKALSLEISPFSLSQLTHQTGDGKGGQWQLNALNRTCESN
ncbi:MAG: histidine phosphatase family protein, partial [Emcibacteraceae bacterium]|nr:histidine phosphatase family protein [Emcibacteraceae bacterium]